jgi:Flp pilus assembly protein TadD
MRTRPVVAVLLVAALIGCASTRQTQRSDVARVRLALAQKFADEGDWAAALGAVQAACQAAPGDPEALTLRGIVLRERGLLDEAKTDLVEAVRLRPDSARAHSALAIVYERQHGTADAEVHHRRALELEPHNAHYLNNLGFHMLARGDARAAIAPLTQAVREDPTNARARNNLGFAYGRTHDFTRAAQQFALGGSAAEAQSNLGLVYELEGNWAQADSHYRDALRLDPSVRRAQQNLDRLAARRVPASAPAAAPTRSGDAPPATPAAATASLVPAPISSARGTP